MRYDSEHKQKTRQRVVAAAAQAIRAEGPDRVGVAGLMAKAGLTHGGFYAHFASKDDLIIAALEEMFVEGRAMFARRTNGLAPAAALAAYINAYLSPRHRDAADRGCPLPRLSGDLARLTGPVREKFSAGVESLAVRLEALICELGPPEPHDLAHSVLAEMVGALALARALADRDQSDALLAASRNAILRRLGLESAT
jgi:TetR/AcrR family transcriptional repressor of nem operon